MLRIYQLTNQPESAGNLSRQLFRPTQISSSCQDKSYHHINRIIMIKPTQILWSSQDKYLPADEAIKASWEAFSATLCSYLRLLSHPPPQMQPETNTANIFDCILFHFQCLFQCNQKAILHENTPNTMWMVVTDHIIWLIFKIIKDYPYVPSL